MKSITNGTRKAFKLHEVKMIFVPTFAEFAPYKFLEQTQLKVNDPTLWEQLLIYMPELADNSTGKVQVKDRYFFYNILNTLKPNYLEKLVYEAHK